MTIATRLKRASILGLALVVTAAGLSLAPIAVSAASASNASQGSDTATRVDALRKKASLPNYKDNGYVQRYVDRYVYNYAKKGASFAANDKTYLVPAGASVGSRVDIVKFTNYKDSAIPKAFATKLQSRVTSSAYNYGSVSYYKLNSKYTYVAIATLGYAETPVNLLTVGKASIAGKLAIGSKLSAKMAAKPAVSYDFVWKAGGEQIGGNTGSITITDPSYVGKKISVTITASRSGYTTVTKTATGATALVEGTFKGKAPALSGKRVVGSTITIATPTWGPAGTAYTFSWLRNGKTIAGATGQTYTQVNQDRGAKIDARITATLAGYNKGSFTTGTKAATLGRFTTPTPVIKGAGAVGVTLGVSTGTWTPKPTKVAYQWYRDGVAIKKATAKTYKTVAADKGHQIQIRVSGARAGYNTAGVVSAAKAIN